MMRRKINTLAWWGNQGLVEFLLSLNFRKHFQDFILILNIYVNVGSVVLEINLSF